MSLAKRSITSAAWNIAVNTTRVAVLIVRSILLARLLPVEVFGVYALAFSVVGLSSALSTFGMGEAFLHRARETEDEQQAAAVHLTLEVLFTLLWTCTLAVIALGFTSGETRTALLILTFVQAGTNLAQTPRLILIRRVVHRRLAMIQLFNVVLSTLLALGLAWQGITLWALLASDVVTLVVTVFFLYIWRPVWKPRLAWSRSTVRYYLSFGSRAFVADLLLRALDQVDDLWTGIALGDTALGYYSRAYRFATYPRFILALPINVVAGGTYAELKGDRKRLSKAFFRSNAFLVRSGFFLGGLLAVIAPEFIRVALGEKWLPMLDAFRLMLVYTLLDPIKLTVANVLTASGVPEKVVRARIVQLVILIAGLFTLGPWLGIAGVALAVNAMLIAGMAILFWQTRAYVDFSLRRLFGVPGLALVLGIVAAYALVSIPSLPDSDWLAGILKAMGFSALYAGILFLLEKDEIPQILSLLNQLWTEKDWQAKV